MKLFLKLFFLVAIIGSLIKGWVNYTCSFRIDKIRPKHFFENHWDVNNSKNLEIDAIDQKFRFFGKGRHTFVFVSDDNKYVIKFFRFHRYLLPIFCEIGKSLPFIKNICFKLEKELEVLYFETMNSYRLVNDKLKDETATLYVHLNKTTNLNKTLIIKDKFGKSYRINLDDYGFVIQKKADSFLQELLRFKDNEKDVEDLLISFFNNLSSIYEKNILNNDRHILNNLGIVDDRVVELDIGRFVFDENLNKMDILEKEAYHYTTYLRKWLLKNIPAVLPVIDCQLIKLIKSKK
jgi:hypothetical protein